MYLVNNIASQGRAYLDFEQYCQSQLLPKMTLDVSRYAPSRYRLWLITEPSLSKEQKLYPAYNDSYLHSILQWLYPGCDTALISFHGQFSNSFSDARIKHHRDTSFASNTARILNLGNVAHFSYSGCRRNNDSQDCQLYLLNPGDLIEFHCKHLHACTHAEPGRISLVMWKLKSKQDQAEKPFRVGMGEV